jgi:hypothetical protein
MRFSFDITNVVNRQVASMGKDQGRERSDFPPLRGEVVRAEKPVFPFARSRVDLFSIGSFFKKNIFKPRRTVDLEYPTRESRHLGRTDWIGTAH